MYNGYCIVLNYQWKLLRFWRMEYRVCPVTGHTFRMSDRFIDQQEFRTGTLFGPVHGYSIVDMPDCIHFFKGKFIVIVVIIVLRMIGCIM